jgi:hypothetical protein
MPLFQPNGSQFEIANGTYTPYCEPQAPHYPALIKRLALCGAFFIEFTHIYEVVYELMHGATTALALCCFGFTPRVAFA